ncbi:MAG: hypothetical protein KDJ66_03095 [Nitratireductor sp.]|nr:hypothetical protein [Nitratireductor sp.]
MRAQFHIVSVMAALAFATTSLPVFADAPQPAAPDPACRYETRLDGYLSMLAGMDSTPQTNPVTQSGASLGRILFFDHSLSKNGLVACSSCHSRETGFDDPTRFSIGFEGRITRRSAMSLTNARFNPSGRYFRDLRAASLEAQVLQPFTDEIEMGLRPGELMAKVSSQPYYNALFMAAFGDAQVTQERISRALAQFVRAITSFDSRYDRERRKAESALDDFPGFSPQENHGKKLFLTSRREKGAGCSECHESEAFILAAPRDNGLPIDSERPDHGLGEITGKAEDMGKFRAASLRNIAVSAPYMHDGRFKTLGEVIDHYSGGVTGKPNLAPELRDPSGAPSGLNLTSQDKRDLIAFLQTLTDRTMLTDSCLADPFRR